MVADPSVPNEHLWSQKYKLNPKMLPTFISLCVCNERVCLVADPDDTNEGVHSGCSELAKKILVIGKSINFIRQCCANSEVKKPPTQKSTLVSFVQPVLTDTVLSQ